MLGNNNDPARLTKWPRVSCMPVCWIEEYMCRRVWWQQRKGPQAVKIPAELYDHPETLTAKLAGGRPSETLRLRQMR